jgi:hypothetical protein
MADSKLEIILTAKDMAAKTFANLEGHVNRLTSSVFSLRGGLAVLGSGAVLGAVIAQFNKGVGAASDYGETVSKLNTIFGGTASVMQRWADGAAESMGLSRQSALDAVGAMGNMFKQLNASTEKAGEMSRGMVELSADIASFHNVAGGANDVLAAMQSAFRGEYDALQRWVPTINAASVEQQALAETHKRNAKELTALEKATATYTLIMRGAGDAAGDFARTSDGLANQKRILNANIEDLYVTVGTGLIPVVTDTVKEINAWYKANDVLINQGIIEFTRDLAEGLKSVGSAYSALAPYLKFIGGFATDAVTLPGKILSVADQRPVVLEIQQMEAKIAEVNARLAEDYRMLDSWQSKVLGRDVYEKQIETHKKWLAELEAELAFLKKSSTEAKDIIDSWQMSMPRNPGAGSTATTPRAPIAGSKPIDAKVGAGWNDFWDERETERMVAQLNEISAMKRIAREQDQSWEEFWDEQEVESMRSKLDEIEKINRESSQRLIELSKHTAEIMEDAFSDLFFDAMQGKLKSLSDYADAFLKALQRSFAQYASQMVIQGAFGKDYQGGGWFSQIGNFFGNSASSGAGGSTGAYPNPDPYAEGGWITEPVLGKGLRTGRGYMIGEGGEDELVIPKSKLGRSRGGGEVTVTIINSSGAGARVEERKGANNQKEVMVYIANDIAAGGPTAQTIEATYGLMRKGRRS